MSRIIRCVGCGGAELAFAEEAAGLNPIARAAVAKFHEALVRLYPIRIVSDDPNAPAVHLWEDAI